jgi:hypothetical protein
MTADQNEPADINATLGGQRARLTVDFNPNTVTLAIDYFARLLISLLYLLNQIEFGAFIGLHIGLFLLEMFVSRNIEDKLTDKIIKDLQPGYKQYIRDFVPVIQMPTNWMGLYMITGVLAIIIVFAKNFSGGSTHWIEVVAVILLTIGAAFLSLVAGTAAVRILFDRKIQGYHFLYLDRDVNSIFPNAFPSLKEEPLMATDRLDANDGMIARMESELKGINSTVDSYMLESVLLGALAFSGFLTIVASNVISGSDDPFTAIIKKFTDSAGTVLFSQKGINTEEFSNLFEGSNLFIVIMFESLICSVFFIMVLTLRLKYSDMSLKIDYLIRVLNIFNAKEEELIVLKMDDKNQDNTRITERTRLLTQKIEAGIADASHLLSQIKPVVGIMSFYRHVGLLFFYLVLVTSGLYFSWFVSLAIMGVALTSKLYRATSLMTRMETMQRIVRRH